MTTYLFSEEPIYHLYIGSKITREPRIVLETWFTFGNFKTDSEGSLVKW